LVDKICEFILNRMKKEMPDITKEKEEVIKYGLQLIIGEIPKTLLLFAVSFLLGFGWYMLFAYITIMPYKMVSGGIHLHTHLGCITVSAISYYGTILLSKFLNLDSLEKYILIALSFVFGILMISLYAPADTENLPIISKKERKTKKILSYIILTITLGIAIFLKDSTLSNILIIGTIMQSLFISRLAYKITNNKYGHEVYKEELQN
jgi:accessory gene regulator B